MTMFGLMKFIRKVSVIINHLIPISNLTRASNIFFEERRKNRTTVGFFLRERTKKMSKRNNY